MSLARLTDFCFFSPFMYFFIFFSSLFHLCISTSICRYIGFKGKKVHYLNVICKLNMWLENAVYYVEFSMIQIHFFVSVHAWFSFHLNVRGKRCCFYLFYFICSFFYLVYSFLLLNYQSHLYISRYLRNSVNSD